VLSVAGLGALAGRHALLSWLLSGAAFAVLSFGVSSLGGPDPAGAAFGFVSGSEDLQRHVLYGVVAALLVAPAVFGAAASSLPGRVLGWAPLAWVGLVSYGIFLWQLPVVQQLD